MHTLCKKRDLQLCTIKAIWPHFDVACENSQDTSDVDLYKLSLNIISALGPDASARYAIELKVRLELAHELLGSQQRGSMRTPDSEATPMFKPSDIVIVECKCKKKGVNQNC